MVEDRVIPVNAVEKSSVVQNCVHPKELRGWGGTLFTECPHVTLE